MDGILYGARRPVSASVPSRSPALPPARAATPGLIVPPANSTPLRAMHYRPREKRRQSGALLARIHRGLTSGHLSDAGREASALGLPPLGDESGVAAELCSSAPVLVRCPAATYLAPGADDAAANTLATSTGGFLSPTRRCLVLREGARRSWATRRRRVQAEESGGRFEAARGEANQRERIRKLASDMGGEARERGERREGEWVRWAVWQRTQRGARAQLESRHACVRRAVARDEESEWGDLRTQHELWVVQTTELRRQITAHDRDSQERREREALEKEQRLRRERVDAEQRRRRHLGKEESTERRDVEHAEEAWARALQRTLDAALQRLELEQLQRKQREAERLRRQREHEAMLRGVEGDEAEGRAVLEKSEAWDRQEVCADAAVNHKEAQKRKERREEQIRTILEKHEEELQEHEHAEGGVRVEVGNGWWDELERMLSDFFLRWNRLKVLLRRRQMRVTAEQLESQWMEAEDGASAIREVARRAEAERAERDDQALAEEVERRMQQEWEDELAGARMRIEIEARREHGIPFCVGVGEEERLAWEAILEAWADIERAVLPEKFEVRSMEGEEQLGRSEVEDAEEKDRRALDLRAVDHALEAATNCSSRLIRAQEAEDDEWLSDDLAAAAASPDAQGADQEQAIGDGWLVWTRDDVESASHDGLSPVHRRRSAPAVVPGKLCLRLSSPCEWLQGGGPQLLFPGGGVSIGEEASLLSVELHIHTARQDHPEDVFSLDSKETRRHGDDFFLPDGAWLGRLHRGSPTDVTLRMKHTKQHALTAAKVSAVVASLTFDNPSTCRIPGYRMLELNVEATVQWGSAEPETSFITRRMKMFTRPPLLRLRASGCVVPESGVMLPYDTTGDPQVSTGVRACRLIDFPDEMETGGHELLISFEFVDPAPFGGTVREGMDWSALPGAAKRVAFAADEDALVFRSMEPAARIPKAGSSQQARRRSSTHARRHVKNALRGKRITLCGREDAGEVVFGSFVEPCRRVAVMLRGPQSQEVRELLSCVVYRSDCENKLFSAIRCLAIEVKATNVETRQSLTTRAHVVVDLLGAAQGTFLTLATYTRVCRIPYGDLAESCLAWVPKARLSLFPDAVVRSDVFHSLHGGSVSLEISNPAVGDKVGIEGELRTGSFEFTLVPFDEDTPKEESQPHSPFAGIQAPRLQSMSDFGSPGSPLSPGRPSRRRRSTFRRISFGSTGAGPMGMLLGDDEEFEEGMWKLLANRQAIGIVSSPERGCFKISFDMNGGASLPMLEQLLRSFVFRPARGRQWKQACGERVMHLTVDMGLNCEQAPISKDIRICVTPPLLELPQEYAHLGYTEGAPPLVVASTFKCPDQRQFPKEDELSEGAFIDVRVVLGAEDEDYICLKGDFADDLPEGEQEASTRVFHHNKVDVGTYTLEPPGYEGRAPGLRLVFGLPESEGRQRAAVDPDEFNCETGLFRNVNRPKACVSGGWLLRTDPHARQVLRNLQYFSRSRDPQALRKVLLITVYDGRRGPSYACCEVEIQAVNDATELHVSASKLEYRQGSRAAQRGFSLMPHARLVDPDSHDFRQGTCSIELASGGDGYDRLDFLGYELQDKRYVASGRLDAMGYKGWLRGDARAWHKFADPTIVALDRARVDETEAVRRLDEDLLWLCCQNNKLYLNNVYVASVTPRGSLGIKGTSPTGMNIDFECEVPLSLRCAAYVLQNVVYDCAARRVQQGVRTYVVRLNANDNDMRGGRVPDTRHRVQLKVQGPLLWAPDFSLAWRYNENDDAKQVNRHVRTNLRMEESVTQGVLSCRLVESSDQFDEVSLLDPQGLRWERTDDGKLFLREQGKERGVSAQQRKASLVMMQKDGTASPSGTPPPVPRRLSSTTPQPETVSPMRRKSTHSLGAVGKAALLGVGASASSLIDHKAKRESSPIAVVRTWERSRIELVFNTGCLSTGRDVELLAKSFAFCNTGENPCTDTRPIEIGFSDGDRGDEDTASVVLTSVDVVASDDPTEIALENSRVSYVLGQGDKLFIAAGSVVVDPDTSVFEGPDGYLRVFFHSGSTKWDQLDVEPAPGSLLEVQHVAESPRAEASPPPTRTGSGGVGSPRRVTLVEEQKKEAAAKPSNTVALLWRGEVVGTVSQRPRDGGLGKNQFKVVFRQMPLECLQEILRSVTYANNQKRDHSLSRSICIEMKDSKSVKRVRCPVSVELHDAFIDLGMCKPDVTLKRDPKARGKEKVLQQCKVNFSGVLHDAVVSVSAHAYTDDGASAQWPPDARLSFEWGKGFSLRGATGDVTYNKQRVAAFQETVLGSQLLLELRFTSNSRSPPEALQSLLRGVVFTGPVLHTTSRVTVDITINFPDKELTAKDSYSFSIG